MIIRQRTKNSGVIFFWAMASGILIQQLADWQLILVASLGIAYLVTRSMRKHYERLRLVRIRMGLCGRCSYDLRGILSDRCPECGEPISPDAPRTPPRGAAQQG